MAQDIRWQQRLVNFKKALAQLNRFIDKGELNEFELAWNTLQDFLRDKGYEDIAGPKPVIDRAFQDGYIDGIAWVRMHKSRNLTSHSYNDETAAEIADAVRGEYAHLLNTIATRLDAEQNNNQLSIFD